MTRAVLLRRGGVAVAALASAGRVPYAFAGPLRYGGRQLSGSLSIMQWTHVIGGFDAWFNGWAKDWGTSNDVEVKVDHVSITRLPALVAKEAAAQTGHDIIGFLTPPTAYEDQVIDHGAIVRAVERQVGPYSPLGWQSTYNPRRDTYFGISDTYVPAPALWRHDLWNAVGESPATWEHVRAAAPSLKAAGYPLGIGLSSEPDSNVALLDLMAAFGSFLQDENNVVAINSPATVEAVAFMADLQQRGQTDEVLGWNQASNNQFMFSGRGSFIVNAISAVRMAEDLQLPISDNLWIWPLPAGPYGRLALPQATSVYSIWKFARNREAAEMFLADFCAAADQAAMASKLYSFPSFPGAFPPERLRLFATFDSHRPLGKYSILATTATRDTCNVGYPGTTNSAVNETLERFLIPRMFAQVAQGKLSAADSVRSTAREMRQIWAKWKASGTI
jgi:multiple sugar transport system substrate-binding protein